ncbi:Mediator complex subunit Med17 [Penicillium chermesinum]|nr:Mediator complex subunit Med17 [Penicillium chermesinum]
MSLPHLGELVLAGQPRKYKKMKVSLSRHELSLSVHRVRKFDALGHGGQEPESQPSRLHVWICNPSEGTTAESSLIDFVSSQTS